MNTIDHSSAKGDKAAEESLDASSVCTGIGNDVPSRVWGNLALNSWNNLINRQIAGVEYIILILFTKSLYNQIHKGEKVRPASQAFQKRV